MNLKYGFFFLPCSLLDVQKEFLMLQMEGDAHYDGAERWIEFVLFDLRLN